MKNSKKGSEFIKWEIGSVPPRIDSNFSGFIIITNLYPLTEEIQWWLGKLALPFIAVVHEDILSNMVSYLADVSIFIRSNSQVQIIQNKRKSKSNMKYEHYFMQNGRFKSQGKV